MIRAIHRRAPNFSSRRLLGTSNRKYDRKKMPAPNPEYRGREMQVVDHVERGESQVDPVEKGNEIADHQERHDAQRHPPHRPRFERIRVCPHFGDDFTMLRACSVRHPRRRRPGGLVFGNRL
jgi:hypothetical protein